jgi:colanic acid/amylovoran biosynthesis protein
VATVINWNFPNSNDSNAARNKYIDSMSETLNNLHASTNLPVKLIVQVENDLPAIEKVRCKLNVPCEIMYAVNTPEKIKELLGSSFCLVASRFHSAIFSLSVGCPVIALSYLPKTSGMLDLYGLSDLHRPIDNFDPQEVASSLKNIASDRQKFIARMKELFTSIMGGKSPFLMYIDSKLSSN